MVGVWNCMIWLILFSQIVVKVQNCEFDEIEKELIIEGKLENGDY